MEFPLGRRQEAHKMKNILISFSRSEQKKKRICRSLDDNKKRKGGSRLVLIPSSHCAVSDSREISGQEFLLIFIDFIFR